MSVTMIFLARLVYFVVTSLGGMHVATVACVARLARVYSLRARGWFIPCTCLHAVFFFVLFFCGFGRSSFLPCFSACASDPHTQLLLSGLVSFCFFALLFFF